ncbi:MAG: tetratricopeptide repeat protein [Selenomonadaceae bacterium]|nr:tetratricopeptide repeat protein [Selenomonadaceae bacterium]
MRFNKRMKKEGQQGQQGGRTASPQEIASLEHKIQEDLQGKSYGAVLADLAKLVEISGTASPDAFYAAAYAYFMQGDYKRATEWVNNTLAAAPSHVAARILLSRLCILEDRTAEALAVLDVLLETGAMTGKERSEIREIVGYYGRTRKDMVCRDYPHIAEFLQLAAPSVPPAQQPQQPQQPAAGQQAVQGNDVLALAHQKLEEIEGMQCSLQEKVRLLCSFAGAWYYEGNLEAAQVMLKEAALLDSGNGAVLRGLALIAAESGDMGKALQYAANIQPTDFVLLGLLRDFGQA